MRQISMMSLSVTSLPVCIIKTSCPRTDSSYRTYCSPQENVWSSTPPRSMPNSSATFSARARWEDPEKSFIASILPYFCPFCPTSYLFNLYMVTSMLALKLANARVVFRPRHQKEDQRKNAHGIDNEERNEP